ncbi:hypothetical protein ACRAWG_06475 [Methylobacterium sp. P31]
MLRHVLIVALLAGPTVALSRPGRAPPLPFAHVEAGPPKACVCGPVRRRSAQVRTRRPGRLARAVSAGGVRSLRAGRFVDGGARPAIALGVGYAPWSRYDDCIWGFAGAIPRRIAPTITASEVRGAEAGSRPLKPAGAPGA